MRQLHCRGALTKKARPAQDGNERTGPVSTSARSHPACRPYHRRPRRGRRHRRGCGIIGGDVNSDGVPDIIVAAGPGDLPPVTGYRARASRSSRISEHSPCPSATASTSLASCLPVGDNRQQIGSNGRSAAAGVTPYSDDETAWPQPESTAQTVGLTARTAASALWPGG